MLAGRRGLIKLEPRPLPWQEGASPSESHNGALGGLLEAVGSPFRLRRRPALWSPRGPPRGGWMLDRGPFWLPHDRQEELEEMHVRS